MRQQVKDGVRKKSNTAQILWENFAHKIGLPTHWPQEAILVTLASLLPFLGCHLNLVIKTFNREVPKLWATEDVHINSKFGVSSAADT